MFKHSVLTITYNHESYIRQMLDSVFNQSILPYEVIISDDASTDKTREVISDYQSKFPGIIKTYHKKFNIGLFANLNSILDKSSGDIVHFIAGDDWIKPGMFERFNEAVVASKLNPLVDRFVLAPNTANYYEASGLEVIVKNDKRFTSAFNGLIRERFSNRCVGYSKALFDCIPNFENDMGLWADRYHELKFLNFCESTIFIDDVFPVYRCGVGVSSKEKSEALSMSFISVMDRVLSDPDITLDSQDIKYIKYCIVRESHKLHRNHLFSFMLAFIRNIRNGIKLSDLKVISPRWLKRLKNIF